MADVITAFDPRVVELSKEFAQTMYEILPEGRLRLMGERASTTPLLIINPRDARLHSYSDYYITDDREPYLLPDDDSLGKAEAVVVGGELQVPKQNIELPTLKLLVEIGVSTLRDERTLTQSTKTVELERIAVREAYDYSCGHHDTGPTGLDVVTIHKSTIYQPLSATKTQQAITETVERTPLTSIDQLTKTYEYLAFLLRTGSALQEAGIQQHLVNG